MDGIFGVGVAEVVVVGLVLFIIGGPENTAKWAREMGRWVRKAREAWTTVMAELEKEMGEEGKEIVDVARELGRDVREVRSMTSSSNLMRSMFDEDVSAKKDTQVSAPETPLAAEPDKAADDLPAVDPGASASSPTDDSSGDKSAGRYQAWTTQDGVQD